MNQAHAAKKKFDFPKNDANYVPLTPLSFLARAALVYPDRTSVVHGARRFTWSETCSRCRRFASALAALGVGAGDTVAIISPNTPALLESHFGVAMAGAVVNPLNYRLDAATIAFILEHGEARVLITDREYAGVMGAALAMMPAASRPIVVDVDDPLAPPGHLLGEIEYEAFLAGGNPDFAWSMPADEWSAVELSYTSGTTGNPKGVVTHHRGAYLNAVANVMVWGMTEHPVYLWTLPMFHASGWCFPWTVTALAGTHVCLRRVDVAGILDALAHQGVTHMCGAPIVVNMLANAAKIPDLGGRVVRIMTAGAPPPAAVIEATEARGFHVTHVYGLTEVYGPVTVCAWQDAWDSLPAPERARIKARQGVPYHSLEGLMVADARTLARRRDHGRGVHARQRGDDGISEKPARHRRGVFGRLVPHRRSRRLAPRRLHRVEGSQQGHHHFRRRKHFHHRGRGRFVSSSGGAGGGGGGAPRREMGRDAVRVPDTAARYDRHGGRHHRVLPKESGAFQGAAKNRVRTAAENEHRKNAKIHTARAGKASLRDTA
jgi:acyl-CoA synthetase (AMP-forming)/AMP-acid ligase II